MHCDCHSKGDDKLSRAAECQRLIFGKEVLNEVELHEAISNGGGETTRKQKNSVFDVGKAEIAVSQGSHRGVQDGAHHHVGKVRVNTDQDLDGGLCDRRRTQHIAIRRDERDLRGEVDDWLLLVVAIDIGRVT